MKENDDARFKKWEINSLLLKKAKSENILNAWVVINL